MKSLHILIHFLQLLLNHFQLPSVELDTILNNSLNFSMTYPQRYFRQTKHLCIISSRLGSSLLVGVATSNNLHFPRTHASQRIVTEIWKCKSHEKKTAINASSEVHIRTVAQKSVTWLVKCTLKYVNTLKFLYSLLFLKIYSK
jgi:hypothetical protein